MGIRKPIKNEEAILDSIKTTLGSGDYTLQEIANILGITRERVRQIEIDALKKLKHPKNKKKWAIIKETIAEMYNQRAILST